MCDAQPYSKVLFDIRERFLGKAAILRVENRRGVCDCLTDNSDQNGASSKNPYKVACAGFTDWMETLGKFAAGHVMTLARMASAHSEWDIADPAEWARIQVTEFVDDELYPKWCRKCGKPRREHSGTDHQFSKVMSRIELWWRMVSGEEEDFDLYEYGRPERWSTPVWIRKNPEESDYFLRQQSLFFGERLKWILHDAEGDVCIDLALVGLHPGNSSGASSSPAEQTVTGVGKETPSVTPIAVPRQDATPIDAPSPPAKAATSATVTRAMLVEKIRREIVEISQRLELTDDYDTMVRGVSEFAGYITVGVCNSHPDICDKLCVIKTTPKPNIIKLACQIASRCKDNPKALLPRTFHDAHKRYGSEARMRLKQRQ